MKKFIGLLAFLIVGCAPVDRYVKIVDEVTPKAVMVEVKAVVSQVTFTLDENGIRVEESTVAVRVRGSGVFISPEGHIVTCDHVIAFDNLVEVLISDYYGNTWKAEVLFTEPRLDLALLKITPDYETPYAKIADPRKIKVGQEVIAVGNPLGLDFSVTHGIISALHRDIGVYNMNQSDAFINPGNSGGPLFNLRGELVGINSRIIPPVNANIFTGCGFSVNSGQIVEFLTRFRGIDKAIPKYDLKYWNRFLHAITGKSDKEN
jgi:serine protease Do